MALVISDSKSSTLEPLRQNRWFIQFTNIPGRNTAAAENLAFCCYEADSPKVSVGENSTHRLNEEFWIAGKPSWDAINLKFYDYIQGANSATQILYDWSRKVYNPVTGQQGFKTEYTTSAILAKLDPKGRIVQVFNIFYAWLKDISWDNLSASSTDLCSVSATLRYDYAIKAQDIDTSPKPGA